MDTGLVADRAVEGGETPRWRRYLRLWGPNPAADVEDEFGFHVQERIDELSARGMDERAARDEALRGFGDIDRVKRSCQDLAWERERTVRRSEWLDAVRHDVLFALRQMRSQLSLTQSGMIKWWMTSGCPLSIRG
jgi:hypothetical protein